MVYTKDVDAGFFALRKELREVACQFSASYVSIHFAVAPAVAVVAAAHVVSKLSPWAISTSLKIH